MVINIKDSMLNIKIYITFQLSFMTFLLEK